MPWPLPKYVEMCSVLIRDPDTIYWMSYTRGNSLCQLTSPVPGRWELDEILDLGCPFVDHRDLLYLAM